MVLPWVCKFLHRKNDYRGKYNQIGHFSSIDSESQVTKRPVKLGLIRLKWLGLELGIVSKSCIAFKNIRGWIQDSKKVDPRCQCWALPLGWRGLVFLH